MIQVKIGGRTIDLKPETKISVTLNSPLFSTEAKLSPGSYTMPFETPVGDSSPLNEAVFKMPDVIENVLPFLKEDGEIIFDGIPFRKGKIKTQTINGFDVSSNFTFGLAAINDEIKTLKLRDCLDEVKTLYDGLYTKKVYLKHDTGPWDIEVNGRQYSGSSYSDLVTAINSDTTEPRAVATLIASGPMPDTIYSGPFLEIKPYVENDPLLPLSVVVDGNFQGTGYRYAVSIASLDDYYANYASHVQSYLDGDYPDNQVRFPLCMSAGDIQILFGDYTYGIAYVGEAAINGRTHEGLYGNYVSNSPFNRVALNRNTLQPFLRLKFILEKIAERLGFEFTGDFFSDARVDKMLLWNSVAMDVPMDFVNGTFNWWRKSYNINELVPDISVVDFLNAVKNRYNLAIYPDEVTGNVVMKYREATSRSINYFDITARSSPILSIDDNSITGIRIQAEQDKDDPYSTPDSKSVGEPETELTTKLTNVDGDYTLHALGAFRVTDVTAPRFKKIVRTTYPLRIFHLVGQTLAEANPDGGPDEPFYYEKASMNPGDESYVERFDDSDGVYEHFWKRWIAYEMIRRVIKVNVDMPYVWLLEFDWTLKRRFDRNNYLVKSMQLDLTHQGISVVKVELATMV